MLTLYSWNVNGLRAVWTYITNARKRNVGWRLDYFFVSQDMMPRVADSAIHADVMGSDHCPISLTLKQNSSEVTS